MRGLRAEGRGLRAERDGAPDLTTMTVSKRAAPADCGASLFSPQPSALLLNCTPKSTNFPMTTFPRPSGRAHDELRVIGIERNYTRHAEGSVLMACGDTRVLCTASVQDKVPPFLRGKGEGWITAEYGMLPRATKDRTQREAARGGQGGRTMDIQRLIGRSLRACVDRSALGERTITLDCDVLQADGGTRTTAITGAYVALVDAVRWLQAKRDISKNPI